MWHILGNPDREKPLVCRITESGAAVFQRLGVVDDGGMFSLYPDELEAFLGMVYEHDKLAHAQAYQEVPSSG